MCTCTPSLMNIVGVVLLGFVQHVWTDRAVNHSPPFSAEAKNEWSYISTTRICFMAWTGTLYIICTRYDVFMYHV